MDMDIIIFFLTLPNIRNINPNSKILGDKIKITIKLKGVNGNLIKKYSVVHQHKERVELKVFDAGPNVRVLHTFSQIRRSPRGPVPSTEPNEIKSDQLSESVSPRYAMPRR